MSTEPTVVMLSSVDQFTSLLSTTTLVALHVHATWAAPSIQISSILPSLALKFRSITLTQVLPESCQPLADYLRDVFSVTTVPTMLYFAHGLCIRREIGTPKNIYEILSDLPERSKAELYDMAIAYLTSSTPVYVAMKGSPDQPKCGFSSTVVKTLRENGVLFDSFDVLKNETFRQRIKAYFQWPTFPMVFAGGQLMGGVDVVTQLANTGKLVEEIEKYQREANANGKENGKEKENGNTETETGASVDEVQGDSEKAEVAETVDKDGLTPSLRSKLTGLVAKNRIVVFIKGSPEEPRCGFSRKMVALLQKHHIEFEYFDILTDNDVRQGLKKLAKWPTFPQVWVENEFMGGLDICVAMGDQLPKELGVQ